MFPQPRTTSVSQDFIHGQVLCLTLSSSGRHIAIATSQSVITIFSAGTGMPVHTLRLKCFVYGIHLSWNGDSELVAACSDGRLLFFYLSREATILEHMDWIPFCFRGQVSATARHVAGGKDLLAVASGSSVEVWAQCGSEWTLLNVLDQSPAPDDTVLGAWFVTDTRLLVYYCAGGLTVYDLVSSRGSRLTIQCDDLVTTHYCNDTGILVVTTLRDVRVFELVTTSAGTSPDLKFEWPTSLLGNHTVSTMRGGHFATYCDQEPSTIQVLHARACTLDRSGPTGPPSAGQLHALECDKDREITSMSIADCAGQVVIAASVYSHERQAFDIQVWSTVSHTNRKPSIITPELASSSPLTAVEDVFWRTVEARKFKVAWAMRPLHRVQAILYHQRIPAGKHLSVIIFLSIFLVITSFLVRPATPSQSVDINVGSRVRPALSSVFVYILRRKLGRIGLWILDYISALFGWTTIMLQLLLAFLVEAWRGLKIVAGAVYWCLTIFITFGVSRVMSPVTTLVAALCREVPELASQGFCDQYT